MDWFERLTGFREMGYADTRSQLEIFNSQLRSRVNGQNYGIGELELVSLQQLRDRVRAGVNLKGKLKAQVISGDVRLLHHAPEYAGALFQVASQFNLLEMVGPDVTPEHGVTRYQYDRTQGPACAIAAGAATIYRNYFAPVDDDVGQTSERQLDGLAGLGATLSEALGYPVDALWTMRNGYAMCTAAGLNGITHYIESLTREEYDALCGHLRIGLHHDVEVTDAEGPDRPQVSQAFCSALPVAYVRDIPSASWRAFAALVLDAAYEATLWAAVLNGRRGASNIVLLTRLGGGAFGNDDDWIDAAMRRAMRTISGFGLDVRIVSYGPPAGRLPRLVEDFE